MVGWETYLRPNLVGILEIPRFLNRFLELNSLIADLRFSNSEEELSCSIMVGT